MLNLSRFKVLKITFCLSTDASVIDTWNARRNRSEMVMVIHGNRCSRVKDFFLLEFFYSTRVLHACSSSYTHTRVHAWPAGYHLCETSICRLFITYVLGR